MGSARVVNLGWLRVHTVAQLCLRKDKGMTSLWEDCIAQSSVGLCKL